MRIQKKVHSQRQKNIIPKTLYLRHRPSTHTICTLELKNVLAYSTCTATKNALPPSCHHRQAGHHRRCAATATLPLPTPLPRCRRHQRRALAKLPPSWLLLLAPRSCQAATATAKLTTALALSSCFRRHCCPLRFLPYRCCCHRCRFRAFS